MKAKIKCEVLWPFSASFLTSIPLLSIKSLWETFSKKEIDEFLRKYEFTAKRIKIRKQFDKKIPFLKNVRFRWWKK